MSSAGGQNTCFGTRHLVCTYHSGHLANVLMNAPRELFESLFRFLIQQSVANETSLHLEKMSLSGGQNARVGTGPFLCT